MQRMRQINIGLLALLLAATAHAQTTRRSEGADDSWGWGTTEEAIPVPQPESPIVSQPKAVLPTTSAPSAVESPRLLESTTIAPAAPSESGDISQQMNEALRAPAEQPSAPAAPEKLLPTAEPAASEKSMLPAPMPSAVPPELPTAEKTVTAPTPTVETNAVTAPATTNPFVDALVATYQNNPRIKAERERQKATDEGVSQALSGFRPTVSADYSKGRQRTAFNGGAANTSDSENRSLSVEQPLFRGFGTISGYQSAKQRTKAGAYTLSATEQRVLLEAIAAYMDVVSDVAILDLARNNREVLAKQLEASNERFNVGEVTRTDVAQSEARLSQAKTQLIAAEGRVISSMAEFERTIGYKPEQELEAPKVIPQLPATLDEALAQARRANPELLAAVHSAKSSEFDVRTRQSTILPRVSLVGSLSRQDGAGVLGSSEFNQDSIAVQVSVPLYQSGAEYSRVREAKNTARQRSAEAIDTRMAVDEAVTQAWEQLETAINTIGTRNDQINAAEIALDGVKQEQEYGARTILDVLDAEQELFNARTNLVAAQRDRVVAAYNLLLTLGRLTPQYLELPVAQYDPNVHYESIKWLPIGF